MSRALIANILFGAVSCVGLTVNHTAEMDSSWMASLGFMLASTGAAYVQGFAEHCSSLQISIPNVQVNVLEYIPGGTNLSLPYNDKSCSVSSQLVHGGDVCRIAMYVSTSNTSGITMEAWLPERWNGRFLSAGNGGLGGCIGYRELAYATSYHFAAVAANNGHNGTSGRPFLNAPEVIEDFAYRSIHTGVVVGKQITEQFYVSPINHSYYLGCSTGGRQGMKSAQKFPEDFDGIVAGAPAFDFNHLIDQSGWLSSVAGYDSTSATFISQSLWNMIDEEVMRQCDSLDGVIDGIIEDPDLCRPILTSLICPANTTNTTGCLNSDQYNRAVELFGPLYNLSGTLIYPRLQPGAHAAAFPILMNGRPFAYSSDWYKYVVYNDASWDATTFSRTDMAYLDTLDPYNISTWNGDLTPFSSRGGKILTYHGLQDNLISSENSARYYSHLASTMSLPSDSIDEFYRYFRIGGMAHCESGPGAFDIGQNYMGRPEGVSSPKNNVLEAIVAWVERGIAPEYIEGIKWKDDIVSQGESFRRRHCRYPRRNVYKGSGDGSDEDGWHCML